MGKKNKGGRVGPLTLEVKNDVPVSSLSKPTSASTSSSSTSQQQPPLTAPTNFENLTVNDNVEFESPLEKLMNKACDEVAKKYL